jgi:hypothetical protein
MNDYKIISKLKHYYLADDQFRFICRAFFNKKISRFRFLSQFVLFSDLEISLENLFYFLGGIQNYKNVYDDFDFLSNSYYLAGKNVAQKFSENQLILNMKRFGIIEK